MESEGIFIFLLAVLALAVPLVLAISAFTRVRTLEAQRRGDEATKDQLWRLELRIQGLEKALTRLYEQVAGMAQAGAAPQEPIKPTIAPPAVQPSGIPASAPPIPQSVALPASPTTQPARHVIYTAPHASPPQPRADFENVVAGKWLNYVGIIAILFAVAFFIKYAFDNNWIGPNGRVGIGIVCGAALIAWSAWLRHRGYEYFSEGIAALGAAVLYLSLWGAWHYYGIFTSAETFAGMTVITSIMVIASLRRNSQRLALLALLGGFLTPVMVSSGADQQVVLFAYVAMLSAAMLTIEYFRKWAWLPPLAFLATELYFWGWYNDFYTPEKLGQTLGFAALFFVLFAALPVMRARGDGRLNEGETIVTIGNVAALLLVLHQMLWPEDRWELTLAILVVAAAHIVVLRVLPEAPRHGSRGNVTGVRPLFAGLALLCFSLAIPAQLDGQWVTIAWAAEGVLLVWSGARITSGWLRGAGLILFAITAMRLLILHVDGGAFLWNPRFMTYMIAVACFTLACIFVRPIAAGLGEGQRAAFAALAIAANFYALVALSLEMWSYLGHTQTPGMQRWLAQQLGLSILWTSYATALILTGMARRVAILRWQALTLFAVVVAKVFFFDLSTLSRFYRILSFLVLGVLLLGVSFLYQKRALAQRKKPL